MWQEIKDEKLEKNVKYFDVVKAIPLII